MTEQPDDFWTDTKSWGFFVDCAQWVPDYIGDFSEWVIGSGSEYDQAGMALPTHDEAAPEGVFVLLSLDP